MIDLEKLKKSATAIFIAVDESVAKDISEILLGAIGEIENLRAKLDKTRKIIDIVHRMQLGQQVDAELFEALKEYREEK